jgi:O-antigen ligase
MGGDYFLGVGLNNYSFAINYLPYGEHLAALDRGIAHHIFWLHYAELGVLGLILYILMTGTFMWVALRFILKRKDSMERVFAIGVLTAFIINWLVGTLEWNFRIIQITLAYFMLAGFVTSLDRVERERIGKEKNRKRQLAVARRRASGKAPPRQILTNERFGHTRNRSAWKHANVNPCNSRN